MQLEAIKVFCDIARLRSFSKAAEANGLSQSAVSRIVHDLEQRFGVQLIDRSRRPLQLTAPGQTYYEGCQPLLDRYLELEATICAAAGRTPQAVSLRVAAIYSVGLGDIRHHVASFEARHPHVKVQIDYLHPDQVCERVLDGSAELGLVSYPRPSKKLLVEAWREEEMVVACLPDHPLAERNPLAPALLAGEKFVAFDRGLTIRREIDRFLRQHGVPVEVALEFDNIENIKKAVEIGAGVALLPEPMLRKEVQTGALRALRFEGCRLTRPLGIIHRRHHRLGSAAAGFLELLQASGAGTHSTPAAAAGEDGKSAARRSASPRTPRDSGPSTVCSPTHP